MVWIFIIAGILFIAGAVLGLMYLYEKSQSGVQPQIDKLQDEKYDPNMTRFRANSEQKAAEARTNLAVQVGAEVRAVTDMTNQQTEAAEAQHTLDNLDIKFRREGELATQKHERELEEINLQRLLIANAQLDGADVATYLEVLKIRALNDAEIAKIEAQAHAALRAGFIAQLKDYQQLSMLRGALDNLYERAWQIESSSDPEPVKQRKLKQVEKDIAMHEQDADGRRKRLLQAFNGKDAEGSDEDTDLR